jgi:hypothetical protein
METTEGREEEGTEQKKSKARTHDDEKRHVVLRACALATVFFLFLRFGGARLRWPRWWFSSICLGTTGECERSNVSSEAACCPRRRVGRLAYRRAAKQTHNKQNKTKTKEHKITIDARRLLSSSLLPLTHRRHLPDADTKDGEQTKGENTSEKTNQEKRAVGHAMFGDCCCAAGFCSGVCGCAGRQKKGREGSATRRKMR